MSDAMIAELLREQLGAAPPDARDYGPNLRGFGDYLRAAGVRHYTATEVCRAHSVSTAERLGYAGGILLPTRDWWPRGLLLLLDADRIRRETRLPIRCRNWWRPADYNRARGGASKSDHVTAHAIDLDFRSVDHREAAESLLAPRWADARYEMSFGVSVGSGVTIHLGYCSPGGRRHWTYPAGARYRPGMRLGELGRIALGA